VSPSFVIELPSPTLAALGELKDISTRFLRVTDPTELGYSYEELKSFDEVKVAILPERKGTLIKHNEYTVESRSFGSSVSRRYKDFENLHNTLSYRYPFRLIPNLPPKDPIASITAKEDFIEQRKRSLKRYLTLICRHPILSRDEVVRYFFTASGQDVGLRIKEKYKNSPDETLFNPLADSARDYVTDQTRMKYERIKEQLTVMLKIMSSIASIAEGFEKRSRKLYEDMKTLSKDMSSLSNETILSTPWTSGSDDNWSKIQLDCRNLSNEFNVLADKALMHSESEARGFSEGAHLFLDLLLAYQDLCNRREKLVHRKHQKALAKVQTMEKYKGHLEAQGKMMSEKHESKLQKVST
jgi:sorting nexin-8